MQSTMNPVETKSIDIPTEKKSKTMKEYQKEYYQKNRTKILQQKKEQVDNRMKAYMKLQETKLEDFTHELEQKKYNSINDLRSKLSKIKSDYRTMKSYTKDSVEVAYNEGTYPTWLLLVNDLIVRQKNSANLDILMKFLQQ